jgi:TetR/AcrR family transcriptional repressor of nem operon
MPKTSDAKKRLMDAAKQLIWSSSYGGTSVDSICERAGVKKGSFYYFFRSKSDLAVAALEEDWKQKKPSYDALFSPITSPLNRLQNYFENVLAYQSNTKKEMGYVLGCPMFTLGSEISTQDPAIRKKVQEILEHRIKYIESALRDAKAEGLIKVRDSKSTARAIFAMLQGALTQSRIQDDLGPIAELKRSVFEALGINEMETIAA